MEIKSGNSLSFQFDDGEWHHVVFFNDKMGKQFIDGGQEIHTEAGTSIGQL